jgi:hypothetical protein
VAIAVAVVAIVAFLPVVRNGFIDRLDDQANFVQNENFRGLGWPQIRWALSTKRLGVYQPLGWLALEAEYALWGLEPWGYHAASIVLHAMVGVLFYWVIHAIVARAVPEIQPGHRRALSAMSGLSAALFAVHPLRVEVVAWASSQPYLPCVAFSLLCMLAYLRAHAGDERQWRWWVASLGFFAISLACKAVPVGLPIVLLIVDAVLLQRFNSRGSARDALVEKAPFFILSVVFSLVAIAVQAAPPPGTARPSGPLAAGAASLVISANALAYYVGKTVWPLGLTAYHFAPEPFESLAPRFIVPVVAVVVAGVGAFSVRKRWPAIPAALLAYAVLLAPNSGLVSHSVVSLVADRYSYLATMPFFVLAAVGMARAIAASKRPEAVARAIGVAGLGLIVILIPLTWRQCLTWHDSDALRLQALRVGSGRDALIESNLGLDLVSAGQIGEGMAHLRRAVALDPNLATAHSKLGQALYKQGDVAGAIAELNEEVRLSPGRPEAHYRLGMALARARRNDEANEHFAEARRLEAAGVKMPGLADGP